MEAFIICCDDFWASATKLLLSQLLCSLGSWLLIETVSHFISYCQAGTQLFSYAVGYLPSKLATIIIILITYFFFIWFSYFEELLIVTFGGICLFVHSDYSVVSNLLSWSLNWQFPFYLFNDRVRQLGCRDTVLILKVTFPPCAEEASEGCPWAGELVRDVM